MKRTRLLIDDLLRSMHGPGAIIKLFLYQELMVQCATFGTPPLTFAVR